jgi:hypothetical protein
VASVCDLADATPDGALPDSRIASDLLYGRVRVSLFRIEQAADVCGDHAGVHCQLLIAQHGGDPPLGFDRARALGGSTNDL